MRLSDAVGVTISFDGKERPLISLIDGWCAHVLRLWRESLGSQIDNSTAWTLHDRTRPVAEEVSVLRVEMPGTDQSHA